jgi:hypothetical protein
MGMEWDSIIFSSIIRIFKIKLEDWPVNGFAFACNYGSYGRKIPRRIYQQLINICPSRLFKLSSFNLLLTTRTSVIPYGS